MEGIDTLATDQPAAADTSGKTIYALLRDDPRFAQFVAVIDSVGLGETLDGDGPFTVFAPTGEAFAGNEQLVQPGGDEDIRAILLYHVSGGLTMTRDFQTGAAVPTLEGTDLNVSGSGTDWTVGGVRIVEPDITASNGVIHAVEGILRPGSSQDTGS